MQALAELGAFWMLTHVVPAPATTTTVPTPEEAAWTPPVSPGLALSHPYRSQVLQNLDESPTPSTAFDIPLSSFSNTGFQTPSSSSSSSGFQTPLSSTPSISNSSGPSSPPPQTPASAFSFVPETPFDMSFAGTTHPDASAFGPGSGLGLGLGLDAPFDPLGLGSGGWEMSWMGHGEVSKGTGELDLLGMGMFDASSMMDSPEFGYTKGGYGVGSVGSSTPVFSDAFFVPQARA